MSRHLPQPLNFYFHTLADHLILQPSNSNLLLTPKLTPPLLTSPPPAPTQPSKLPSPLAINLDPIELLFSTPSYPSRSKLMTPSKNFHPQQLILCRPDHHLTPLSVWLTIHLSFHPLSQPFLLRCIKFDMDYPKGVFLAVAFQEEKEEFL
ncbi:hypothetical protein Tco_0122826 [Tanacetum coccineum]